MNDHITLDRLRVGESATVSSVCGKPSMARRLRDIGVTDGTSISCLMRSPLGDPVAYLIRGAVIALRREDSQNVSVTRTKAEVSYETRE